MVGDNVFEQTRPVLRPATQSDSEFAYQILRAALGEYVEQTWGWDEGWQRRHHHSDFDPTEVQIITCQGKDVGWLLIRREPEAIVVSELYLSPDSQGRGIGSFVLNQVLCEAGQSGLPVRLGVLKVNVRARRLYERLGFRTVSETDVYYRMEALPGRGCDHPKAPACART